MSGEHLSGVLEQRILEVRPEPRIHVVVLDHRGGGAGRVQLFDPDVRRSEHPRERLDELG
jgi:hypothetical protein